MKYLPYLAAFAALIPSPGHAQNAQFSDCHSLEAAGNYIGADEVLVNGQVCKIGKPKANPSTTEKSKALFGIMEPEVLRGKNKAANESASGPAPATPPNSKPNDSTASEAQPPSFQMISSGSLGEIARAYRKSARTEAVVKPQEDALQAKKSGAEPEPAAVVSAKLPVAAPVVEPKPPAKASAPRVAPAAGAHAEIVSATPIVPAVPAKLPATPDGTSGAKSEVVAVPQAPPEIKLEAKPAAPPPEIKLQAAPAAPLPEIKLEAAPAAPPSEPEMKAGANLPPAAAAPAAVASSPVEPTVKVGASLPTAGATRAGNAEGQGSVQAGTFASANASPKEPSAEKLASEAAQKLAIEEAREAESAPEADPEREHVVKLGDFIRPAPAPLENPPGQPIADGLAGENEFREGQTPSCVKNVSLGSLEKERLFLALPAWALSWYGKNQKRFPGICFSNSLMPGVQNYLVVFYTVAPRAATAPLTRIPTTEEMTPVSGTGSFTANYGGTWHYTYERTVTTTITSESPEGAPHNQPANVLYATTYSEQGIPLFQHWPEPLKQNHKEKPHSSGKNHDASDAVSRMMADLLSQMVEDIAKL